MGYARRIEASVLYSGKDITEQIRDDLKSLTYEDVASGTSDSISLELKDPENKWLGPWMPEKGAGINVSLSFKNWLDDKDGIFHCGDFQIDEITSKGRPSTVTIGGAAIPQDNGFNSEERSKTWESGTIRLIGNDIAQRAGLELYYEADEISIAAVEQNEQTDCSFLYKVCQDYGLGMKVYSRKIVIFDEEKYESRNAPYSIKENDIKGVISWKIKTSVAGTYTGAKFSFSDPNDDKEYQVNIGDGNRILNINVTADNIRDAELKGIAKLNNENKKATIMTITIMANPYIVATQTVEIIGFGKFSGKYYIDKVSLKATAGGATQQTLTLRKVVQRIKNVSIDTVEEAIEEEKINGTDYVVKAGDTLWKIAKEFLDDKNRYVDIYNANKDTIESAAKAHGKTNSGNGHWIYPGTTLIIPQK